MSGLAWLFDLDDTLHNASPHIFPHIDRSMTEYIARELGMSEPDAQALRMHYWQRYGATLRGLSRHHGVDPHHFLWHTHRFPELARMVVAEGGLRHALKRLPGRKILFTNSPLHYAQGVLEVLGIAGLFDAVYAIESTRLQPKPEPGAFRLIMRAERLTPARTVMVEDSLPNLRTARMLGLRTVWVSREARRPRFVDLKIAGAMELPRALAALRSANGIQR